jgi:hypothetical protein
MKKILFLICVSLSSFCFGWTGAGSSVGTIQNRDTLQSGATFYVSSGTVADLNAEHVFISDNNSSFNIFLGTLPINGGFGPQVVQDYIWNKTNVSNTTPGGFSFVVSTAPLSVTGSGAPDIQSDGSELSISLGSIGFRFYDANNPGGVNSLAVFRDMSSADSVSVQGGTVTAISGNFSGSVTAPTYYFASTTYLNFTGSQVCLYVLGAQQECWPAVVTASYFLREDGTNLLREDGTKLQREQ